MNLFILEKYINQKRQKYRDADARINKGKSEQ